MFSIKRKILGVFKKYGVTLSIQGKNFTTPDIKDPEFLELYQFCRPFTMTSIERMFALFSAVRYVLDNKIPGDFVECGVWRGGSSMLVARMLRSRNVLDRKIFLMDTFEGMPPPTVFDKNQKGISAEKQLSDSVGDKENSIWCRASLDLVKANMQLTKFPQENIVYIKGKVEETLPSAISFSQISLLRLDTDWYESTLHELKHLYPLLQTNGVLIIDDYGFWQGCRKAVDEYFADNKLSLLLSRIDETGRMTIKTH